MSNSKSQRLGLMDSLYLRACNFALDYASLASSVAAGVAIVDSNNSVFSESVRAPVIGTGIVGGAVLPAIESLFTYGKMYDTPILDEHTETLHDKYISSELNRNLFAGLSAVGITTTIKTNSLFALIGGLGFGALATISQVIHSRTHNQIREKTRTRLESQV